MAMRNWPPEKPRAGRTISADSNGLRSADDCAQSIAGANSVRRMDGNRFMGSSANGKGVPRKNIPKRNKPNRAIPTRRLADRGLRIVGEADAVNVQVTPGAGAYARGRRGAPATGR